MLRYEHNDSQDMEVDNQDQDLLSSSSILHHAHLTGKQKLNDLIRDLNLSVRLAESLGTKLKECNL